MQAHSALMLRHACGFGMQDVVAGRLRSSADRIAWLLEHSRFEQALHVADSDSSLKASVRQQVRGLP